MKQAVVSLLLFAACSKPDAPIPEGSNGDATARDSQAPLAIADSSVDGSPATDCKATADFFRSLNSNEEASCAEGLHRLAEWKAYAEHGAAACSGADQGSQADALARVVVAIDKQIAAGKERCQVDPPVVDAAATAAPQVPAPSQASTFGCGDIKMQLNRYSGLLPDGVPPEAAPSLITHPQRLVPIEHGNDVTFIDGSIKDAHVTLFRFANGGFEQAHSVAIPRHPVHGAISSYQIAAAMSPKALGVALVSGRELFFVAIDRKKWTTSKVVALGVESIGRLSGLHDPHIVWGEKSFGITADDDSRFIWTEVADDGKAGKPMYFKGSGYVPPLVTWTGEGFGVLTGRAGDFNAHSLGIWEMPTKMREHAYRPIIDPPPDAPFMGKNIFHVGGALRWQDGAYHFVVLRRSESHRKPDPKVQIVHFTVGSAPRFDDCGRPPE